MFLSPAETSFQRHLCIGVFADVDRSSSSKAFPWKCAVSYTESFASQGCEGVLSCQGTIAPCITDCPSFIHRSYFLPEPVFWFIHHHRVFFLSQAIGYFEEKKRVTILLGILMNTFAVM